MKAAPKTRANPRLSLNKLAEYLSASASRRQSILREQKKPVVFMTTWYAEAEEAILDYLLGQCSDLPKLKATASQLANKPALTDAEASKYETNSEALARFIAAVPILNLSRFTYRAAPHSSPKLLFSGVEISVRPDVLVEGVDKKGQFTGCVKLHFSKQAPFAANSGAYVATILHEHAKTHSPTRSLCRCNACCVIDVFGGSIFEAPKATAKRLRDVQAACKEIAALWPTV